MRAIITGAASGIGAAATRYLSDAGANIIAVDIEEPASDVEWIRADLSDPHAIEQLSFRCKFDALVNAAGLPPRPGLEHKILAVNYFGLVQLTAKVLPLLKPGASIVSMASKAGSRWRENLEQVKRFVALEGVDALPDFIAREKIDPVRAYDLSKEAVIWWTKSNTSNLLKHDIRANTVSPAAVDTPILADFEKAFGERAEKGIKLMGRAGTADEIGRVIAFLASPHSSWIKGVDLAADGGLTTMLDMETLSDR